MENMFYPVLGVFMIISTVWVYFDVTGKKIGRVKNADFSFNWSVWEWMIALALLWVVFFPAYLYKREELIDRANEHPRTYKRRSFGGMVLVLIILAAMYLFNISGTP